MLYYVMRIISFTNRTRNTFPPPPLRRRSVQPLTSKHVRIDNLNVGSDNVMYTTVVRSVPYYTPNVVLAIPVQSTSCCSLDAMLPQH